ncbi:Aste57867_8583 [Aphanomyces stellatus]|uniref:Aste57867_8583 protein n=1 Tax=Aphanomyces stellatus TaxID=120398 RepID=A0A485KKS6_9STRA|nr:hypothetical protein As57867_008551 [Aphanomyces stellatus]VFT85469.1 Aste57867_8583 [Aphanomyces stellatus]
MSRVATLPPSSHHHHPHANKDDVNPPTTCKYIYKPCTNPRAMKRSGALHSLCDHHRAKANAVQKAYAQKKRHPDASAAADTAAPSMLCKYMYKPCTNPRALKRNGDLHSLCPIHQNKANACQKQYASKKRHAKMQLIDGNVKEETGRGITLPPLLPSWSRAMSSLAPPSRLYPLHEHCDADGSKNHAERPPFPQYTSESANRRHLHRHNMMYTL